MPELRLIPLGVGNAFSTLYYSTSLALVAADGRWLLVDCPHPIHKILREASLTAGVRLELAQLVGVTLTHLHADHASGLEGLGGYLKYVLGSTQRPDLFSHPVVLDALRPQHEAELFNLVPVASPCTAGPFTIETRVVTHGKLAACAFRVSAAGRSVGHSGDTVFDGELIRWLGVADLVVHEAGADGEGDTHHTTYQRLVTLPAELRGKLRLVHFPDEFDVSRSVIEPLRQGAVYAV